MSLMFLLYRLVIVTLLNIGQISQNKSGGIVIVYIESHKKYLNFPKSCSEFVQWLIIKKKKF
jgi:hypothetical protein